MPLPFLTFNVFYCAQIRGDCPFVFTFTDKIQQYQFLEIIANFEFDCKQEATHDSQTSIKVLKHLSI